MPGKKPDRKDVLVTEILSQVGVIYESLDRMKLNDAQLRDLHRLKTKLMTTMAIVFIVTSMRINLRRRWHKISMTDKIPVVEERLGYKVSRIFILKVMLRNHLTFLML